MKIAQIGSFPLDPTLIKGGVESSVFGLARELSLLHEVYVYDLPRIGIYDNTEIVGRLQIFRFRNSGKRNRDMVKRIPAIINNLNVHPVDICHIHGTSVFCYQLFLALKRAKIPVIITVHGLAHIEKKKLLSQRFSAKVLIQYFEQTRAERRLLSDCQHTIVDTPYVSRAIQSYGLKKPPIIHVIPQGINSDFFDIQPDTNSNVILSVGTFSARKGHLLLIQAFELLSQAYPSAHLTICGTMADATYYERVVSYVSKSPYNNKISIVTDASQEHLLSLYQKAHVFALHSQEESQGVVFAEAMAAGLPVVSTRIGGIPDVVADGDTGLLSEYGNIELFAQNLLDLMTNRMMWERMSSQCRIVAKHYSWASLASSVESIYNKVI